MIVIDARALAKMLVTILVAVLVKFHVMKVQLIVLVLNAVHRVFQGV